MPSPPCSAPRLLQCPSVGRFLLSRVLPAVAFQKVDVHGVATVQWLPPKHSVPLFVPPPHVGRDVATGSSRTCCPFLSPASGVAVASGSHSSSLPPSLPTPPHSGSRPTADNTATIAGASPVPRPLHHPLNRSLFKSSFVHAVSGLLLPSIRMNLEILKLKNAQIYKKKKKIH